MYNLIARLCLRLLRITRLDHKVSSKYYLKIVYLSLMGRSLRLSEPVTFNEKLQWLKLYYYDPRYTKLVDKSAVKEWIVSILGKEAVIPTLGEWTSTDDVDFDCLPEQFVLKCTHDSGGVVICKDKNKFDWEKYKQLLNRSLETNYYYNGREWPYKDVPHKIIAEPLLETGKNETLTDYKFFCFNGVAKMVMLCIGRDTGNTQFYFFDRDWNLLRYNVRGAKAPRNFTVKRPSNMDEMFNVADKLSHGIPFVRVDLYSVKNKVVFGEMTFFPDSGFDRNILPEADVLLGKLLKLPNKTWRVTNEDNEFSEKSQRE